MEVKGYLNISRLGRPPVAEHAEKRSLSLTLGRSEWDKIDALVAEGYFEGRAQYFRHVNRLFLEEVKNGGGGIKRNKHRLYFLIFGVFIISFVLFGFLFFGIHGFLERLLLIVR